VIPCGLLDLGDDGGGPGGRGGRCNDARVLSIEARLAGNLNKQRLRNIGELKRAVRREWKALDPGMIAAACAAVKKRFDMVIVNQGSYIE
jgi:hypothetical protein